MVYIKTATAQNPIIQKEVDELLVKGAIEPSVGCGDLYSTVSMVPKDTSEVVSRRRWISY